MWYLIFKVYNLSRSWVLIHRHVSCFSLRFLSLSVFPDHSYVLKPVFPSVVGLSASPGFFVSVPQSRFAPCVPACVPTASLVSTLFILFNFCAPLALDLPLLACFVFVAWQLCSVGYSLFYQGLLFVFLTCLPTLVFCVWVWESLTEPRPH